MKRAERRHLKDNELRVLTREMRDMVDRRKRETTTIVTLLVVVGAAGLGYLAWRERTQSRAQAMLVEAKAVAETRVGAPVPAGSPGAGPSFPTGRLRAEAALAKYKAAADAYPSTDAGIFARYQQAATLLSLERPAEAVQVYRQAIDRAGDGIYGQMARLGVAEAQARAGKYDDAIDAFKELAQRKDGPLPVDGILMQLGKTYLDAGKRADAQQTFDRLVQEYPNSPFSGDAMRELENLKKT